MMKLTDPPALILTSWGMSWCSFRNRGERLGNRSSGGSVCHWPKLTVAPARGPSIAVAAGMARAMRKRTPRPTMESADHLISASLVAWLLGEATVDLLIRQFLAVLEPMALEFIGPAVATVPG